MAGQRISVPSGNIVQVRFKLNAGDGDGVMVGIMQNVDFQENFGHQPITGIGRVNAFEHSPGAARFSLSAGFVRLRKKALNAAITALGLKNLEETGIVPAVAEDILKGLTFDIVVKDVGTAGPADAGGVLWTWTDCSYDGGSLSVRAHQVISQNCSFLAIDRQYAQNPPSA